MRVLSRVRLVLLTLLLACTPGQKDGPAPDSGMSPESGTSATDDTAEHTGSSDTSGSDTDSGACTPSTWYTDADDDGYGDPSTATEACEALVDTVADGTDCDDADPGVHPGAEDACYDGTDTDCDGGDDFDCDGDGFASADYGGTDCDDSDGHRYPGATELCRDGVVNDCEAVDDTEAEAFCSGSGPFSLEGADAKLIGERADDKAGDRVAGAGDIDGDGMSDLLVVAGHGDTIRVNVMLSPLSGAVSLSDAQAQIYTEGPGDGFTAGLSGAGDVNEDGLSDILAGAPFLDKAYLILNPVSGALSAADADTVFIGDTDSFFGCGGAGLGDVSGDGLPDLLISAELADGRAVDSDAGYCATEDDGDLAPGENAGIVYLFEDPPSGEVDVSEADARLIGEDAGDLAGDVLAGPGDLDGDGLADIVLSAPGDCESGGNGAVYVVLSPALGDLSLGDADGKVLGSWWVTELGGAVSGAGDTDGDGTPDLLVSDSTYNRSSSEPQAGVAFLFLGPVSGVTSVSAATASIVGEGYSYTGGSVASAGDLDADGFDDVVIGAWAEGAGHSLAGAAYILHGPLSGALETSDVNLTFVGVSGDRAACSVAGVGDADADGVPDLLVGAYGDSEAGTYAGAAYLLLSDGALLSGDGEI